MMKKGFSFQGSGFGGGCLILSLLLAFSSSVNGQQIILRGGQVVETKGLRRDKDLIMGKVQVGASTGEVGYQIAQIEKIVFPEPRGIKSAADLLSQGQAEKALAEINPVVAYYDPFKDINGSWWAPAALIKVSALAALQRAGEAEPLALLIQKNAKDPESARAANLRIAGGLIKKQEFEKATPLIDSVIKESTSPATLADAWVMKGNLLFSRKEWDGALMAYLRVPVFYPEEKLFLPQAMLGSGRAYRRLEDLDRAKKSFSELIAAFPKSAEAGIAQTEMQKIKK